MVLSHRALSLDVFVLGGETMLWQSIRTVRWCLPSLENRGQTLCYPSGAWTAVPGPAVLSDDVSRLYPAVCGCVLLIAINEGE